MLAAASCTGTGARPGGYQPIAFALRIRLAKRVAIRAGTREGRFPSHLVSRPGPSGSDR